MNTLTVRQAADFALLMLTVHLTSQISGEGIANDHFEEMVDSINDIFDNELEPTPQNQKMIELMVGICTVSATALRAASDDPLRLIQEMAASFNRNHKEDE